MKDLSTRGLVSLAISVGATTPVPSSGNPIAWSTTLSEFVFWNGTSWQILRTRASADVTVVDWFTSTDGQFNGTTINLNTGKWTMPPVAYAPGQTILLLTRSNENAYNGVYVLGSVASPSAVPLTRHPEWPSTRVVAAGHKFYVKNVYRNYNFTGEPDIPDTPITGEFTTSEVDTANDRIQLSYSDYPNKFAPGTRVRFTTTGTLPTGLSAGTDYYVYQAFRDRYLALPRLSFVSSLGGSPIDITSVGSGTGTITVFPRWGSNLDHDIGNIGLVTLLLTEWDSSSGGSVTGINTITSKWVFANSSLEPELDSPGSPNNQYFIDPVVQGSNASTGAGIAIGSGSIASGPNGALSIGGGIASGSGIAIGGGQIGPANDGGRAFDSIAVGGNSSTIGGGSIAIGSNARAENNSLAVGVGAAATRSGVTLGTGQGYNPQEVLISAAYSSNVTDNISSPEDRWVSFQMTVSDATETAALCGGQDGAGVYQPVAYASLSPNAFYVVDGEISAHDQMAAAYSASWRLFGTINAQSSDGTGEIHGYVVSAGSGSDSKNLKFRFFYDATTNRLELYVTGIASSVTYWRATVRLRGHNIYPYGGFAAQAGALTVAPPGCFILPASEALTSGQLVNIWNDSGTVKVRAASRTLVRAADGYIVNNYLTTQRAAVFTSGVNPFSSGLSVGPLWLNTSGSVQSTEPTADLSQQVGFATSATAYVFQRGLPIEIT